MESRISEHVALLAGAADELFNSLQEFLALQHIYKAAIKEIQTKLEILNEEFNVRFARNPIHHVESRLKSSPSILKKLKKKGCEISVESAKKNLNDIAGIRVVCCYIDDVYDVADMLLRQSDIELVKVQDYIKHPKDNGYRSLHLIIGIPIFLSSEKKYVRVEVQFRTIAMDFWASLDHKLKYKKNVKNPELIAAELKKCADTISSVDLRMQEIRNMMEEGEM